MSTIMREGRHELSFDASWRVLKWDEATEYKGSMEPAFSNLTASRPRSVQAADVIGVRRGRGMAPQLLVAEFKDFDRAHLAPEQRAAVALRGVSDELMHDVIAKVVDSLCGAAFAHDTDGARSAALADWRAALGLKTTGILVLVCVELPPTQVLAALTWTTALKKRLRIVYTRSAVQVEQ